MNVPDIKSTADHYRALETSEQIDLLAFLAWELTVLARDAYGTPQGAHDDAVLLRTMNELQHQILGHLQKLLIRDAARFSGRRPIQVVISN